MTEATTFAQLLEKLATATSPGAQAALVAESAFAQLDPTVALVAQRCIVLRWFDPLIVAALLPAESATEIYSTADDVTNQLAQLPFVERLPWGLTYHEQTRTGLLERYASEQPDLLQQAALLAAPAYQQHPNQTLAGQEVLYCWLVGGEADKAQQQLDHLIDEAWEREDWNGLLALFTTSDQAATLGFVQSLQYTTFHYYMRGMALRQLGNYEEAVGAYQQAVASHDKNASSWNGLGVVYRDQQRYDDAIATYQQAIAINDKYASPWNNLGNVYSDQQRYDDAIAAYQQAIAIDDQFAYPWDGLGAVYRNQQRYDDAIAAHQQAIALDDQFASPWNNLGNVYSDQQRYDDAIAAFRQAIALDDKSAAPWNNLGLVYRNQKRYDDAIDAYQQAIAIDDKDADYWHYLGLVYRILQRWREAEIAVRHALALAPTNWNSWFALADILRRLGDQVGWQEALAQAQPLADYNHFYNAACFESVAGNEERALALLAQAAAKPGFNTAWAQEDPDLEWIRHDPRFAQIVTGA